MKHGIPTKYHNVQFRSRLEAHWAAFFDLAGWRWEYEPLDLPGWIPDFKLCGAVPMLVEVKPLTVEVGELPLDLARRLVAACVGTEWSVPVPGRWTTVRVMILGNAPTPGVVPFVGPNLGWLMENAEPGVVEVIDAVCSYDSKGRLDIYDYSVASSKRLLVSGEPDANSRAAAWTEVEKIWREAGNLVQWKKP